MSRQVVLIFDVDDTLYDQTVPFWEACKKTLGERITGNREVWYHTFKRRSYEMYLLNDQGEVSLEESRILRIQNTMKDMGMELSEEEAQHFQDCYLENQRNLRLSKEMEEILSECSRFADGIGVLTNGPVEHQMTKVEALQLTNWIPKEKILISGEAGISKPDRQIFSLMEQKFSFEHPEFWMIGDSERNDIGGAKEAGWNTILFQYRKPEKPQSGDKKGKADYEVIGEAQLKEVLHKILNADKHVAKRNANVRFTKE